MATLRDIKRRITSVKSTQQITKAMKMVAAAKLRRAQENILNARPYSRKISEVLSNLLALDPENKNPLFERKEIKTMALVVVTSDRGLCGGFNMNLIREAARLIHEDYAEYYNTGNLGLYCIGKKGYEHFTRRSYRVLREYIGIFGQLRFQTASSIVSELKTKYLNHEIDKVVIVYNEFKSVMQQKIVAEQLLPIPKLERTEENGKPGTDYIYEPGKGEIIDKLLPRHLNSQLWRILLESYASELGAKMTAMDMATENAKELIKTLQVTYNKARQASITKEILEIVSGANAMKAG